MGPLDESPAIIHGNMRVQKIFPKFAWPKKVGGIYHTSAICTGANDFGYEFEIL